MTEQDSRSYTVNGGSIREVPGLEQPEQKIKGLKAMILVLLMLLILCVFLVGYNMLEIHGMRKISAGLYYTEEQCAEMFGVNESFEIKLANSSTDIFVNLTTGTT